MDFLVFVSDQRVFAFFLFTVTLCADIQSVTALPLRMHHNNTIENVTVPTDTFCPLYQVYCQNKGGCINGISKKACHREGPLRFTPRDPLACEPGKIKCADKTCVDDKMDCEGYHKKATENTEESGQHKPSGHQGGSSTVHIVGGAAGGTGGLIAIIVVWKIFRCYRVAYRVARVSSTNTVIGGQSSQPYRRFSNPNPPPGNLTRSHAKLTANASPTEGAPPDKSVQPPDSTVAVAEKEDVACLTP